MRCLPAKLSSATVLPVSSVSLNVGAWSPVSSTSDLLVRIETIREPFVRLLERSPPGNRVLPVGEKRPERRHECQRLIEDQMVMRFRYGHDRRVPAHQVVHVLGSIRRYDHTELASKQRHPRLDCLQLITE